MDMDPAEPAADLGYAPDELARLFSQLDARGIQEMRRLLHKFLGGCVIVPGPLLDRGIVLFCLSPLFLGDLHRVFGIPTGKLRAFFASAKDIKGGFANQVALCVLFVIFIFFEGSERGGRECAVGPGASRARGA